MSEGNGTDSVDFGGGAVNGNVSVSQGNGNNDQVNFGVNFANLSNTSFSETTTIGGNLAVTQGNGNIDEVNFGVTFGNLYSTPFTSITTIGGNVSLTRVAAPTTR